MMRLSKAPLIFTLLCLALLPLNSKAANQKDDAGTILNGIERNQQKVTPLESPPKFDVPKEEINPQDITFKVTHFIFEGNNSISSEVLEDFLKKYLDKPITYNQLKLAANSLTLLYKEKGFLGKASIPKQDITAGIVRIVITEAKFGGVKIDLDPNVTYHVNPNLIRELVEANNPKNLPLNIENLDRSIMIANDLSGVRVEGTLQAGELEGQTESHIKLTNDAWVTGGFLVDNSGARSTGPVRYLANGSLLSPLKYGDRGDALYLHTSGSDYGRLTYDFPLGLSGLHVGINGSALKYNIVEDDVNHNKPYGDSQSAQITLSYPIYRTFMTDIRLSSFLEYKHFSNSNNTDGLVSKYEVNTFNLGLSLKQLNSVLAGGQSNVAFNFDDGDTNYGGSSNQASQSQQDTGGHFNRLRANVVHTQFMQDDLSVVLKANGQWSDVNLDSSQKFYLGGASGVRAYPVNEGAGSNGFVVNAEIRKKLPFNVSVTGFYDYGYARQYVNDPSITGGSIIGPNNFNLQGYGLSLDWLGPYRSFFSVSAAQRLGHNPNAIGGNDSDGTSPGTFYWFQTQISF